MLDKNIKNLGIIAAVLFFIFIIVKGLGNALTPLILSFIFSYLLYPVVQKVEKFNIRRPIAVILVMAFCVLIVLGMGSIFIPIFYKDVKTFLINLPGYFNYGLDLVDDLSVKYNFKLPLNKENILEQLRRSSSDFTIETLKNTSSYVSSIFENVFSILLTFLSFFLFPLFFYYVMCDYEKIARGFYSYVPRKFKSRVMKYSYHINEIFSGYIRGQLLVAIVLGFCYTCGLSIIGLRFGFIVGIITGTLSFIPFIGFTTGLFLSLVITFFNFSYPMLFSVILVFLLVVTFDTAYFTPKVVGNKVGLNSLETILGIIIFGNLLGFIGVLVAIPVSGILKFVISDLKDWYKNSEYYKNLY